VNGGMPRTRPCRAAAQPGQAAAVRESAATAIDNPAIHIGVPSLRAEAAGAGGEASVPALRHRS
jgi:hypothetical protein